MAERTIEGYNVFLYRRSGVEGNIGGVFGQTTIGRNQSEAAAFNTPDGLTGTVALRFRKGFRGANWADVTLLDTGKRQVAVNRATGIGFITEAGGGDFIVQALPIVTWK